MPVLPGTCARSVSKERREARRHRSKEACRSPLNRAAGKRGCCRAKGKRPCPVFGRHCPQQSLPPGHSSPIAPTISQRFSSPSDLFSLRGEDSLAPRCFLPAKLKRSFSVTETGGENSPQNQPLKNSRTKTAPDACHNVAEMKTCTKFRQLSSAKNPPSNLAAPGILKKSIFYKTNPSFSGPETTDAFPGFLGLLASSSQAPTLNPNIVRRQCNHGLSEDPGPLAWSTRETHKTAERSGPNPGERRSENRGPIIRVHPWLKNSQPLTRPRHKVRDPCTSLPHHPFPG